MNQCVSSACLKFRSFKQFMLDLLFGLSVYRSAVDLRLFVLRHGAAQPERNEGQLLTNSCTHVYIVTVSRKKDQNVFVISPTKLKLCWQNLAYRFLNPFAEKRYKHFPTHVNNDFTLPCET